MFIELDFILYTKYISLSNFFLSKNEEKKINNEQSQSMGAQKICFHKKDQHWLILRYTTTAIHQRHCVRNPYLLYLCSATVPTGF